MDKNHWISKIVECPILGGIPNCTIIAFEWGYFNSFVIDGWGAGNLKFRAQCAQWGECWKVKQKEYLHDKLFINKRKLFNTSDSITRTFILSAKKNACFILHLENIARCRKKWMALDFLFSVLDFLLEL